ncbi:MAG: hypothetical protein GY898_18620 [Proteobacteria bacterium]|nr:hypothetical protein [Pseudomonadota bacterium]
MPETSATTLYEIDGDGDGFGPSTDCDDTDSTINPDAAEVCDGTDNNCDGSIDEGFDTDSDTFTTCAGDCDDTDDTINPDAVETCDGVDEDCGVDDDCDGDVDEEVDEDGDGYGNCTGDCDDSLSSVNPSAVEVCNGVDDDCDGVIPPDDTDASLGYPIDCFPGDDDDTSGDDDDTSGDDDDSSGDDDTGTVDDDDVIARQRLRERWRLPAVLRDNHPRLGFRGLDGPAVAARRVPAAKDAS